MGPAILIEVHFRLWQQIGMDLFFCKGQLYLLVCAIIQSFLYSDCYHQCYVRM